MSNLEVTLKEAVALEGAIAAALVDFNSGMTLGVAGEQTRIDMEVAGAGATDLVRAKQRSLESLGSDEAIEDILITLDASYHVIRLLSRNDGLFLYLVLDRSRANLALARHKLRSLEEHLEI